MAFHSGGYVGRMMQPQNGNERIVKVEVGEYVMQRRAVNRLGQGTLDYINRTGQLPSSAGSVNHFHLSFTVSGGASMLDNMKEYVEDVMIPQLENAMASGRFRGTLKPV
jgi:hypothetical protein